MLCHELRKTRTPIKGRFFASRRRALMVGLCAVSASGVLATSSVASVAGYSYVTPNTGLVISGHSGHVEVILIVTGRPSYARQRVLVTLGCYGRRVAGVWLPITYSRFALVRHAEFATRPGFRAFRASGYFRTSTTAHVDIKLVSLAVKRSCAPSHGQAHRQGYRLRINKIHKRGTPTAPPQGAVSLSLTACPTNPRGDPLPPNRQFEVRGKILPAHAGEWVRVEYTTLQGQPATGKPTVFAKTQPDGTFSADFGVPNNNGNAAEAGVSAYAFGKTATCTFFDK